MPGEERERARRLAWRLTSLPEAGMRRAVLAEVLRATPPPAAVRLLRELVRGPRVNAGPPFAAAIEALAAALHDPDLLPYDARAGLYAAAREAGAVEVARLLLAPSSAPGDAPGDPDPEQVLAGSPPSAPDPGATGPAAWRGKPLTLGERKALARGPRGDLLDRLLRDPDADVIRVLLGNPHLVERDVVLVAARRPAHPSVLRAVFESRWLARYPVKRALVLNPYTPTDLAVRLVPALTAPDQRAVAADPKLADAVRAQAAAIVRARDGEEERD
jgi:hypothetical protein